MDEEITMTKMEFELRLAEARRAELNQYAMRTYDRTGRKAKERLAELDKSINYFKSKLEA